VHFGNVEKAIKVENIPTVSAHSDTDPPFQRIRPRFHSRHIQGIGFSADPHVATSLQKFKRGGISCRKSLNVPRHRNSLVSVILDCKLDRASAPSQTELRQWNARTESLSSPPSVGSVYRIATRLIKAPIPRNECHLDCRIAAVRVRLQLRINRFVGPLSLRIDIAEV
jgi:hypothetical protein